MTSIDNQATPPCRRRLNRFTTVCLLLLVLFGCGSGEYERRMNDRFNKERAAKASLQAKFGELYAAQELQGSPVSVRMPTMFKDPPLVDGALINGKPVDPRRVKAPLFDLPWLKLTCEGFVEDPALGKLPYYCYIGAIDMAADKNISKFDGRLHKELSGKPKEALSAWESIQAETPESTTIPWKKLRFTGPQEFFTIDKAGQEQYKEMPGVLEVYLYEEAGQKILMAWRMPAGIEQQVNLAKWSLAVAGCVSVKK